MEREKAEKFVEELYQQLGKETDHNILSKKEEEIDSDSDARDS